MILALLGLLSLSFLFVYLQIAFGIRQPWWDVRVYWRPISDTIAAGGVPYVDATDNKPPLFFLLLTIAGHLEFLAVMAFVTGVGNAILICWVYRWLGREGRPHGGVIAAGIVTIVSIQWRLEWGIVDTKTMSLAVLVMALTFWSESPGKLGVGVGAAGLLTQQTAVAVPIVAWYCLSSKRQVVEYALGGLAVVAGSYGAVGLLFGWSAMWSAVDVSFFEVFAYSAGTSDMGAQLAIWSDPYGWAVSAFGSFQPIVFPVVASLIGFGYLAVRPTLTRNQTFELLFITVAVFLIFVRSFWHYGFYLLLPLAVIAGRGLDEYVTAPSPEDYVGASRLED